MTGDADSIEFDGVRLDVVPAPGHDEAAAIVLALRLMRQRAGVDEISSPSGWRLAARQVALRGDLDAGRAGWRISARLET